MRKVLVNCLLIVIGFTLLAVVVSLFIAKRTTSTPDQSTVSQVNKKDDNNLIIDATKFELMPKEELIKLLGKPNSEESMNWTSSVYGDKYPIDLYTYNNDKGKFEYWIYGDKVVRIGIELSEGILFKKDEFKNLKYFGLSSIGYKSTYTGVADRFERRQGQNGPKIVWIQFIEDDKIKQISIIYHDIAD